MAGIVDIGEKETTKRVGVACGELVLGETSLQCLRTGDVEKGNALEAARIAALLAVKETPRLLPYCHNIAISAAQVHIEILSDRVAVTTTVESVGRTGVEMEALTATLVGLATLWDMVKYLEKDLRGQYPNTAIQNVRVVHKAK